jgi:hypothetical protein
MRCIKESNKNPNPVYSHAHTCDNIKASLFQVITYLNCTRAFCQVPAWLRKITNGESGGDGQRERERDRERESERGNKRLPLLRAEKVSMRGVAARRAGGKELCSVFR